MNLHKIVSSAIGAVNPNQTVAIFTSVGNVTGPDGTQAAAYATPGQITASIGGTFVASAAGLLLTVSEVVAGSLQAGDAVSGSDGTNALPADAAIQEQLAGVPGGTGVYLLTDAPAELGSCTVTAASTVLNVSALSAGLLLPGQTLSGSAVAADTMVTSQLSGTVGAAGLYALSNQQIVAAEAMTTSLVLIAQIQAMSEGDLRHMDSLNLQGSHRSMYVNNNVRGAVRVAVRGGDLVQMTDGSVYLVNQSAEPFFSTAGWNKVILTLQNSPAPTPVFIPPGSASDYYVTEGN